MENKEGTNVGMETVEEIQNFRNYLWKEAQKYISENRDRIESLPMNHIIPFEGLLNLFVSYCVMMDIPIETAQDALKVIFSWQQQIKDDYEKSQQGTLEEEIDVPLDEEGE